MNNLEDKLIKIKTKKLTEGDKDAIWHGAMVKIAQNEQVKKPLLINILKNYMKYDMKKMIVGVLAVIIILGGGGVVAASNDSLPGDFLFPVDLAVEKVKISLASENKKSDLKLKFAEERISEIKNISDKKSVPAVLVADLSGTLVTEIEVDVFTNETLVKIEANDKKYGYISTLKTKEELIKEIAKKYSIDEIKVSTFINFQIEDRTSGADDKTFLNKTRSVHFSEGESNDVGVALTDIENLLKDNNDPERSLKIEEALKSLLVLLGDDADIEFKKEDGKIRIETASGDKIKIEFKDDKSGKSSDDKDDDSSDDLDDDINDDKGGENKISDDSISNQDVKEDDSEVFCRGEWRDAEDCNGDSSDDMEDEEDFDDEDLDDDMEDEEDDIDEDEDEEDDNSGQGGGDDDEDDEDEDD
ncbi:MAG: hypothetical protein QG583_344 [Patescibacteria group bacterium]|nr:hypothetical protein [Patescibacteria group bacterium]